MPSVSSLISGLCIEFEMIFLAGLFDGGVIEILGGTPSLLVHESLRWNKNIRCNQAIWSAC